MGAVGTPIADCQRDNQSFTRKTSSCIAQMNLRCYFNVVRLTACYSFPNQSLYWSLELMYFRLQVLYVVVEICLSVDVPFVHEKNMFTNVKLMQVDRTSINDMWRVHALWFHQRVKLSGGPQFAQHVFTMFLR